MTTATAADPSRSSQGQRTSGRPWVELIMVMAVLVSLAGDLFTLAATPAGRAESGYAGFRSVQASLRTLATIVAKPVPPAITQLGPLVINTRERILGEAAAVVKQASDIYASPAQVTVLSCGRYLNDGIVNGLLWFLSADCRQINRLHVHPYTKDARNANVETEVDRLDSDAIALVADVTCVKQHLQSEKDKAVLSDALQRDVATLVNGYGDSWSVHNLCLQFQARESPLLKE